MQCEVFDCTAYASCSCLSGSHQPQKITNLSVRIGLIVLFLPSRREVAVSARTRVGYSGCYRLLLLFLVGVQTNVLVIVTV